MEISPVEIVTTDFVIQINVNVIKLEMFKSATLYVSLTTNTGKQINGQCMDLSGDDYKNWSNDDNYLYTYAAGKLGYTIQPTTVVINNSV